VQKLIAINRIQNKSLCLHNIFVCAAEYNYFVYIYTYACNTYACMYIFKNYLRLNSVYIYKNIIYII